MLNYPYITWLTIFVFIPSIILWVFNFNYLKTYLNVFVVVIIGSFIWGFCFDIVGSVFWDTWTYHNTLGPWFFGLPLEEYLILLALPQELAMILLILRKKIYG